MLEYNNGRGVPWCSRFQRDCFFFTGGASPSPTDIMGAIIVRILLSVGVDVLGDPFIPQIYLNGIFGVAAPKN